MNRYCKLTLQYTSEFLRIKEITLYLFELSFFSSALTIYFDWNWRIPIFGFFLSQELQEQNTALEFEISLKALSVLRYITDHANRYSMRFPFL